MLAFLMYSLRVVYCSEFGNAFEQDIPLGVWRVEFMLELHTSKSELLGQQLHDDA
jgi:hypothetical protein